jgi:hypothetical protein
LEALPIKEEAVGRKSGGCVRDRVFKPLIAFGESPAVRQKYQLFGSVDMLPSRIRISDEGSCVPRSHLETDMGETRSRSASPV